jgi:hypothetical protein
LPGLLFRFRLMLPIVPMLTTCVGLVARIKVFLFRSASVGRPACTAGPTLTVPPRTTIVFPAGTGVVLVVHLVVLPWHSLS